MRSSWINHVGLKNPMASVLIRRGEDTEEGHVKRGAQAAVTWGLGMLGAAVN